MPDAFVVTVIVLVLLLNTPEAPEAGDVNVTFTDGTGLFVASRTVTDNALANGVLAKVLCGVVPAFAVIEVGVPTVFVKEKFAVVNPAEAAVTV